MESYKKKEVQGMIKVMIPEQEKRPARLATCQVRFSEFKLTPPRNHIKLKTEQLPTLSLYAIYVTEKNSSKGVDPIDWMLLTNLPVFNYEDCRLSTAECINSIFGLNEYCGMENLLDNFN